MEPIDKQRAELLSYRFIALINPQTPEVAQFENECSTALAHLSEVADMIAKKHFGEWTQ